MKKYKSMLVAAGLLASLALAACSNDDTKEADAKEENSVAHLDIGFF